MNSPTTSALQRKVSGIGLTTRPTTGSFDRRVFNKLRDFSTLSPSPLEARPSEKEPSWFSFALAKHDRVEKSHDNPPKTL